jgi:hypothetical protein
MSSQCTDKFVGSILASWRYDISGIAPDMRGDYESHFASCPHCRGRRKLHRIVDFSLIGLTSASAFVFLLAFGITYHFAPRHALLLELAALFGFGLCALVWLVLMLATPAPVVMFDAARQGAKLVHDRLPPHLRDRIPEEVKSRLAGD